jgi:hypothetical protein
MPNIVLTGLPRSGSTLTCNLLNRCADTIALHEPIPMGQLAGEYTGDALTDQIDRFFADTRQSLLQERRAVSKLVEGRVPDNTFGEARGGKDNLRRSLASHGEVRFEDKELTPDFLLAIKHNAGFAAMLDRLKERYPCYGIVRHPLAVLSSWNSVNLAVQQGHVPVGEQIDSELRGALERIADRTERQFYILEWFFERFARLLPRESILRYEDLIATGGKALAVVVPAAGELAEPLESRNVNTAYAAEQMRELGGKLLGRPGAFWEFYSRESVEEMLAALPTAEEKAAVHPG